MINIPLKLTFLVRGVKVSRLGQSKVGVKLKRVELTVATLIHGVIPRFGLPANQLGNATSD